MHERSFSNARRSARIADKKSKKVIVLYVGPRSHARTWAPSSPLRCMDPLTPLLDLSGRRCIDQLTPALPLSGRRCHRHV